MAVGDIGLGFSTYLLKARSFAADMSPLNGHLASQLVEQMRLLHDIGENQSQGF